MKRNLILISLVIITFFLGIHNLPASKADSPERDEEETPSKKSDTTLVWYKYDDGLIKAKKEKKHSIVFFYTNWCGWCKRMEKQTFADQEVRKVLNESYVPIRVNGQSGERIKVDGKEISERQVAGMYKVNAYPVTWFLKPSGEAIAPKPGYTTSEEFLYILNWVKDDLYKKISFEEFVKQEMNKKSQKE